MTRAFKFALFLGQINLSIVLTMDIEFSSVASLAATIPKPGPGPPTLEAPWKDLPVVVIC